MNYTKVQVYIGRHISVSAVSLLLGSVFLILGVCYGYLIQATVRNAVVLDKKEADISTLNSSVGELEGKYMTLISQITQEKARQLGFSDYGNSKFISRPTVGGKLSLNNEI